MSEGRWYSVKAKRIALRCRLGLHKHGPILHDYPDATGGAWCVILCSRCGRKFFRSEVDGW